MIHEDEQEQAFLAGFLKTAEAHGITDKEQCFELYKQACLDRVTSHPAFQAGLEKAAAEQGTTKEAFIPQMAMMGLGGLGLGTLLSQRGRQRLGGTWSGFRNMFGGMGKNFNKGYSRHVRRNPTSFQRDQRFRQKMRKQNKANQKELTDLRAHKEKYPGTQAPAAPDVPAAPAVASQFQKQVNPTIGL